MQDQRARNAGLIVTIAGGLTGLGAFLPWIQVTTGFGSVSRSGIDGGGDGLISLGLGIAGLIAGLNLMNKPGAWSWPFLIGLGITGLGILDYTNVQNRVDSLSSDFAAAGPGAGLYLTIAAGILMVFGALHARSIATSTEKVETPATPE